MAAPSGDGKGRYLPPMSQLVARGLGVFFVAAGVSKLIGWLPPLERFYQWQLPGWWMVYAVGILQLAGGIGIWREPTRGASAWLLAAVNLVILSSQVRFGYWWDALLGVLLLAMLVRVAQAGSRSTEHPPAL